MKKTILLCCGLAFTSIVQAGGFKIALQGIKQIGMGHTGTGFAQDAATIYFNPGGLSFVAPQLNIGGNLLMPRTDFLDKNTGILTNANPKTYTPVSAYGSFRLAKNLVGGVGVYTPFGSGISYPADWGGRYILRSIDLKAIFIQPTLSYKISDNFAIGAGIIATVGSVKLEKDIPTTNSVGSQPSATLEGHAKTALGANVGLYFIQNQFSAGVTYHSRIKMEVENGDATFNNVPAALQANFPTTTFSTTLPLPSELSIGAAYRATPQLTITADYNFTNWSTFDSLGFDYGSNTPALSDDKSPRLYQNASAIRIGAQYKYNRSLMLRAGFFADQTPVQDSYIAPELPDNNKIGLSIGATAKLADNLDLDVALLYENVPARTSTNIETQLYGTYKTRVISPAFGISYKFNNKPKIKY
jgi:long-chain fatty acid transport protein